VRFDNPAALWGLFTLALLILFSLWRQAAARVTVPSLLLWKKIPERNPPIRALRRPRWRMELLLQALAISAVVGALAGPYTESDQPKPRRVALVLDNSARMRAGDRLAKMKTRAAQMVLDTLRNDRVTCYGASPSPRSFPTPDGLSQLDGHVDLEPLLVAARAGSEHVVVFSDRPVAGADLALFGAPQDNIGIVEFSVSDDEVFVRLAQHGPPRAVPLELTAGETTLRETLAAGQRTWSRKGDYSKATAIRVAIDPKDSFPLDDVVEATRVGLPTSRITLKGRHHDALVRMLRILPRVTVDRGDGAAQVSVGFDEAPGPADVRVWLHSSSGRLEGEPVIKTHPLMSDLDKRGLELASADLGALPDSAQGGQPLITVGGKVAASIKGREVHLAIDVNKWQGLASFPIFWVNVQDYARQGATGWVVARAGHPVQLPLRTDRTKAPEGAVFAMGADGTLIAWTVGDYSVVLPEGSARVRVNLLDERESDTAGETRAPAWNPSAATLKERMHMGWAGPLAGSAIVFLVLAWLLQLRPE
jgi:hypothetical protein